MIKESAVQTLRIEASAITNLISCINDEFEEAVKCIFQCNARVVVTGMGKSGHIGRKIAASLASTGTPSLFMHPAEAFHGDLGMVTSKDVVIAISNSGETAEIINILPIIHQIGAPIIAMCSRRESSLGKNCQYFIDISVEREASPLGLAPTSSTTATLAMGDAITIALIELRHFTAEDFAVFHPGGTLGKKLLLKVEDIMHHGADNPVIFSDKTIKDALFVMTEKGLGAVSVIDKDKKFIGLITDGDIRRYLSQKSSLNIPVKTIMTISPITISRNVLAAAALNLMESHKPNPVIVLPVIENGNSVGMIHLTDLLKQGIV